MLFSEPKIPQLRLSELASQTHKSFSALQRAENSSITASAISRRDDTAVSVLFSEPKIPQWIWQRLAIPCETEFQCSSASRKFLNFMTRLRHRSVRSSSFSALQRAENSSIPAVDKYILAMKVVSVLFSEPKIPQFPRACQVDVRDTVSVLFSEPKIPQYLIVERRTPTSYSFSALQRAENSSILSAMMSSIAPRKFQCSSASRKFLNCTQIVAQPSQTRFQCSSASRKFLNGARQLISE